MLWYSYGIKVEIGDPDGEKRTLHCYGKTEAEAKAWGEQELERLKRDGLTGSFQTFGHVLLDVLDVIGIKIDGERKGKYQVHKNTITYGSSGFRQDIAVVEKHTAIKDRLAVFKTEESADVVLFEVSEQLGHVLKIHAVLPDVLLAENLYDW